jgi:hypothetical protein
MEGLEEASVGDVAVHRLERFRILTRSSIESFERPFPLKKLFGRGGGVTGLASLDAEGPSHKRSSHIRFRSPSSSFSHVAMSKLTALHDADAGVGAMERSPEGEP